jgi:putative membrane protein insertion efficiency factor
MKARQLERATKMTKSNALEPLVAVSWPRRLASTLLIGLVLIYQSTLSPIIFALFGRVCRFEPSCSAYFIQAVRKHGPWRGGVKGVWRVCRCNPFCRGGWDPV